MKIYMDNCCFNRIFDDRSQPVIYFERNSILLILRFVEMGLVELYGSQMLVKEINDAPDEIRRGGLKMVYSLCSEEIKITRAIAERAVEIRQLSNIRNKDSIHLACAELARLDYLITVDKKFKNNANRINSKIKVISPIELLEVILW